MTTLEQKFENIFRPYDVRGVFEDTLTEPVIRQIGAAFVKYLQEKQDADEVTIVVGRDSRSSSPEVFQHFTEGASALGANIISIGLSTSPMLYFATRELECDGGVQITASHNPPEYNGMKFVDENANSISAGSGLEEVKELTLKNNGDDSAKADSASVREVDILDDYMNFILDGIGKDELCDLDIVVDTANAAPGIVVSELADKLPLNITHLYADIKADFPNHLPDPIVEENIADLKKKVVKEGADLGVAFDGDGDRVVFVDEHGDMVSSDYITAMVAKDMLAENPGGKIVYTVISSNIIKDVVEEHGGEAIPWKVGRAFVPEKMREVDAIFGGEYSGHFFSKDAGFSEVPFAVMFAICAQICKAQKPLSEIVSEYDAYAYSGVINLSVDDKQKTLADLEGHFDEGEVTKIDGIRIDHEDWWFIARASNTEDLLRIAVEAENYDLMEKKLKEIKNIINKSNG